jgi:fucose 4-O-acetylase-like acetyltransferase
MVARYVWSKFGEDQNGQNVDASEKSLSRTHVIDNAKAVAMWLVIAGHIFCKDGYADSSVVYAIKMIHMPMFSLISGICSQSPPNAARARGLLTHIVLPGMISACFINVITGRDLMCPDQILHPDRFVQILRSNAHDFLNPLPWRWPWYMLALSLWRSLAFAVWPHLSSPSVLLSTLFISCLGGYFDLGSELGFDLFVSPLSSNAICGFFPYFAIGYVLPFQVMMQRVNGIPLRARFFGIAFAFLWIFIIVTPHVFLAPLPDGHAHYRTALTRFDRAFWWTRRLTKITVDTVAALSVLFFVVPRGESFLTHVGRYTLYSYLYMNWFQCWHFAQLPNVLDVVRHSVLGGFVSAFLILLICTSWLWRLFFSWHVEPVWADALLHRIIPDPDPPESPQMPKTPLGRACLVK